MHTKKIARNATSNFILNIVTLLLAFVTRRILLDYLGSELLGLNSMYSNLLTLLNMADLGIGTAFQFALYKPIIENNQEEISALLAAAEHIFSRIAVIIVAIGIVISFFLDFFIKENTYEPIFLQSAFIINVLGIASSYFFVQKRLYLTADERAYICNYVDTLIRVSACLLQIFFVIVTSNYFIYLAISVFSSLLSNIFINLYYNKFYPKHIRCTDFSRQKVYLLSQIKDVLPGKIGIFLNYYTDNLVISSFFGLKQVAYFSNYTMVTTQVIYISGIIANSAISSFGKIMEENEGEGDIYKQFNSYNILQFLLTAVSVVGTGICLPFLIEVWLGKEYCMGNAFLYALMVDLFFQTILYPLNTVVTAKGLFKHDKQINITVAIINVILSIILVNYLSVIGAVIGTIVADIVNIIYRAIIVYREFGESVHGFYRNVLLKGIIVITEYILVWSIVNQIRIAINGTIVVLLLAAVISVFVTISINCILLRNDEGFKYVKNRIISLMK